MILVEGEGFDPADGGFLEPMFNDSSTGAGQGLVNIDVENKEFAFPLHLKSATKDGLHTLIRSLRMKLNKPSACRVAGLRRDERHVLRHRVWPFRP